MALTAKQKNDVLFYLGWPGATLDSTSLQYNKVVADRINDVADATQTRVIKLLGKLEAMDTRLDDAADRLPAKQVADIELNNGEIEQLKKERRRLVMDLGRLIDVRPMSGGSVNFGVCS